MLIIAVIEDDISVLDAVRLVLEFEGWTVRAYGCGEAFLTDLAHYRPDCIILDPRLPDISGAEIARAVAHEAPTPIICLTAYPDSPITKAIEGLGVRVILTKPVSAKKLVGHVREVLSEGLVASSDTFIETPD
ncbi:MAG: FixJ family two-component response regulator [Gammaproteobacteria bacterium]|jgi:FixJ family two-component response regulator